MKALTLYAEWLPAILKAADDPRWKRVENRVWPPPQSILGQWIALHAGTSKPTRKRRRAVLETVEQVMGLQEALAYERELDHLVLGAIIATARVDGYFTDRDPDFPSFRLNGYRETIDAATFRFGEDKAVPWWFRDQCGWHLSQITPIPPRPCKGGMKLWDMWKALRAHDRRLVAPH